MPPDETAFVRSELLSLTPLLENCEGDSYPFSGTDIFMRVDTADPFGISNTCLPPAVLGRSWTQRRGLPPKVVPQS